MSPDTPLDLRRSRILIANDDGIHAQGLAELEAIARQLCDDVWVCVPETEQSASSHSLTITRPLRIRKLGDRRFTVDGTPTDCVLLGINQVMKDNPPDLLLSGINMGSNIGDDVTYSGTIAAAMEATLLGIPAIALSQHIGEPGAIDWSAARRYGPEVIQKTTAEPWAKDVLINVNFPNVPAERVTGMHVVPHGKHKIGDNLSERTDPRGQPYYWIGVLRAREQTDENTDIAVVGSGGVSVTPLSINLNHAATRDRLAARFA